MAAVAWNHSVKRPQYQPQRDASGCNPLICPLAMRILAAKLRLMSSEHRNAICFSYCHIVQPQNAEQTDANRAPA